LVTVYPDKAGIRWWCKAWFNNSENGEPAVEIAMQQAVQFLLDRLHKDEMLQECYPKQMEAYHKAILQTKEHLLTQLNM
jgi:hypothetical protein